MFHCVLLAGVVIPYLRQENDEQCHCSAGDDEHANDEVTVVGLILDDIRKRHGSRTDDHNVVHTDADEFRVVQRWNADLPRLPGEPATSHLQAHGT